MGLFEELIAKLRGKGKDVHFETSSGFEEDVDPCAVTTLTQGLGGENEEDYLSPFPAPEQITGSHANMSSRFLITGRFTPIGNNFPDYYDRGDDSLDELEPYVGYDLSWGDDIDYYHSGDYHDYYDHHLP